MENRLRCSDIEVIPHRAEVFKLLGVQEGTSAYELYAEEYAEMEGQLKAAFQPHSVFCFGNMPEELATEEVPAGIPVVFSIMTVGEGISRYSTQLFEDGDYVKGMIADAAGGAALFELERQAMQLLKEECAHRHLGIRKRLEAPTDIPMDAQKVIFEICKAQETGMRLSESNMLIPVKSSAQILVLTEDESVFRAQHDCSRCSAVNCRLRKTAVSEKE